MKPNQFWYVYKSIFFCNFFLNTLNSYSTHVRYWLMTGYKSDHICFNNLNGFGQLDRLIEDKTRDNNQGLFFFNFI